MILEIILGLSLALTLTAIGFMAWYIRSLLTNLLFMTENVLELQEELTLFKVHLDSIYKLEMFYGEETLGGLLKHGKVMLESLEKFNYFYDLLESGETSELEEELTEQQEELDNSHNPAAPTKTIQGKTIFYDSP